MDSPLCMSLLRGLLHSEAEFISAGSTKSFITVRFSKPNQNICKYQTEIDAWGWIESSACIICYLVSDISIKAINFWQFPLLIKLEGISVEELIPAGTSKAKKSFFQELRKLIKLPGGSRDR